MLEHFESGFNAALCQMASGVLSFVFLAYLLHLVGTRLKKNMSDLFGKAHRVIVIPGEFFRNAGVAIACMITGVKMRRHVITNDSTGTSASITHSRIEAGTPTGFIRNLIILTAPIWFGCIVLMIIALVAGGAGLMPDVKSVMSSEDVGLVSYVVSVFTEAVSMLLSFVCVWHWTSPFCLFCLLCFVSIATEITIDTRSVWAIKSGLFGLFVLLILVNAIPGISSAIANLGKVARPVVFGLHVTLLFVVIFDFAAACVFGCVGRIFRRKGKKGKKLVEK